MMKNCRICIFIRYFIISVVFIVITSVVFVEDLSFFSFVTPWNAVKIIFILGIILFISKVSEYFKKD